MPDAYVETLAWLYRLQARAGIELKLARVHDAVAALGHPERAAPTIHVGGTNGKGSTVSMLAAVRRAAGQRVGVFTSPHLVSFRERITIDGVPISEGAVVEGVHAIRARLGDDRGLTSFEIMTLLAWWYFAREGVDVVVLEVGLGGRLDATNVVQPIVTVITNVAHDHEAFLGSDLAGIAAEKAGIVKPGIPVVTGAAEPARTVIRERAIETGSPIHVRGDDFDLVPDADGTLAYRSPGGRIAGIALRLAGRHQQANAALALRALEVAPGGMPAADVVRRGLADVDWPGRLQVVCNSPRVLLDSAHNPAAVGVVVDAVRACAAGRTVRVLFGVMRDKAWQEMLDALQPLAAEIVLTRPRQPRSADPEELARVVGVPSRVEPEPEQALTGLMGRSAPDDVILVTGSIFLIGDVLPVVDPAYRGVAARERAAAALAGRA